jgi:cytosine/uracil/thiamine/allantoin permease
MNTYLLAAFIVNWLLNILLVEYGLKRIRKVIEVDEERD